jgi:hypothetical protein
MWCWLRIFLLIKNEIIFFLNNYGAFRKEQAEFGYYSINCLTPVNVYIDIIMINYPFQPDVLQVDDDCLSLIHFILDVFFAFGFFIEYFYDANVLVGMDFFSRCFVSGIFETG